MRFYKGNELYENIKEQVDLCLCHKEYNHCVSTRDDGIILEISPNDELNDLDIGKKIASQLSAQQEKQAEVTTTEAPTVTQALGFEELTDDIAITSQAQENLMFAVGEMSEKAKESMSYELDELVLKCSFNQKDCQMDRYVF